MRNLYFINQKVVENKELKKLLHPYLLGENEKDVNKL
jgi:hypothetical protein